MDFELPPGFRFHPTDEELIIHYLRNHATSRPCPVSIIPQVNICKLDPWELRGKSSLCEEYWYFFSPRDRKYPNGERPNRATPSGYWKATGSDKAIYSNSKHVGVKKALVFYRGRPPKGSKTEWIMHEYRLGGPTNGAMKPNKYYKRVDEWVLCRIYQKKRLDGNTLDHDGVEQEDSLVKETEDVKITSNLGETVPVFPRSWSLVHILESDCILDSQLFDEQPLFGPIDQLFNNNFTADMIPLQSTSLPALR